MTSQLAYSSPLPIDELTQNIVDKGSIENTRLNLAQPSSCEQSQICRAGSLRLNAHIPAQSNTSRLTGIQEDTHGEVLLQPNPGESAINALCQSSSGEFDRVHTCAAPLGFCYAPQGIQPAEWSTVLVPNLRVSCVATGCGYGGPIHFYCLQRWLACCETRCQLLANSKEINPSSEVNVFFTSLSEFYRCPKCDNCSLQRFKNDSHNNTIINDQDPFASLSDAMCHIRDRRLQTHQLPHSLGLCFTEATETTGTMSISQNCTIDCTTPIYATESRHPSFALSMKRSSWHTFATQTHFLQQLQQQYQLSGRSSQRRGSSISGPSSSSTNSSALGSSLTNSSLESSRRPSQNTHTSDGGESCRTDDSGWSSGYNSSWYSRNLSARSVPSSESMCIFNFDPMPPLTSDSPTPVSSCTTDVDNFAQSWPEFLSQPSHQTSRTSVYGEEVRLRDADVVTGDVNESTWGQRHFTTSNTTKSSNWPPDSTKSRSNHLSESDKWNAVNHRGNIFQPRPDFLTFKNLPPHKRNAYFIQMDDDSCTGNEDTRSFLLTQLTNHSVSEVKCLICHLSLTIYDHFPVIDGIFFISPVCHRSERTTGLRITWNTNWIAPTIHNRDMPGANISPDRLNACEHSRKLLSGNKSVVPPPGCLGPRQQVNSGHASEQHSSGGFHSRHNGHGNRQDRYLHAICMRCLQDTVYPESSEENYRIRCRVCSRLWSGASLLVGGLYTYDVFAATPCCSARLTCNSCKKRLDNSTSTKRTGDEHKLSSLKNNGAHVALTTLPLPFFSQYSQLITCPFCLKCSYHFVKPFAETFKVIVPN